MPGFEKHLRVSKCALTSAQINTFIKLVTSENKLGMSAVHLEINLAKSLVMISEQEIMVY